MISLPDLILPKTRHFGLSVERSGIHVLELVSAKKPPNTAACPLPPEVFSNGVLVKPELLIAGIRQAVDKANIRTPYVAVTFPEVFAFTRAVSLPNLEFTEMHEALIWRIKELFPLPEEEIYFDWKILDRSQAETTVSVVAVQRKVMDPLVEALVKAGLKPLRFEPDASALSRLISIPKDHYALLVEINGNGTYMTLVENDKSIFTTNVQHSHQDTPESYLANINQGLQEMVGYYREKKMLTDTNTAVIVTGEMGTPEWSNHISRLLNFPTSVLSSRIGQPAYFKAYAAAISAVKSPDDAYSINVLSKSLQMNYENDRREQMQKIILGRGFLLSGFLAAVSVIFSGMLFFEKYRLDAQIRLEKEVGAGTGVSAQKLSDLNLLAKTVVSLDPLRKVPTGPLRQIAATLTEAVSVSQWDYDDKKLMFHLTGMAATREDLLAFKSRLENEKSFSKVTLPLGTLETPVSVPFTISFILTE